MKQILIVLLLAAVLPAFSQSTIKLTLSVVNFENKPRPGLEVVAQETITLKKVTSRTDAAGKASFELDGGKEWVISVGEMRKCMYVVSFPNRVVTTSKFLVYDPKTYLRKQAQNHSRSNEKFRVIPQTAKENTPFAQGDCSLTVTMIRPDGRPLTGLTISAVNLVDSIVYTAKTNDQGKAFFILPNKKNYEIDVDHIRNFHFDDFGDEYAAHNLRLVYEPTVVKEKIVNDTIYQEVDEKARPSSERTLMRIAVRGGKKNGALEPVYLRQIVSGEVYASVTNKEGYAYFLIPTRQIYMVDMQFQKDIDAVNLMYATELTSGNLHVYYDPDPRLEFPETFIPTPDRLLLKHFNDFLQKQYTRPVAGPFNLEVKSIRSINKQSREALFRITLAGAKQYGNVRLPVNIALVLDKSGSMFGEGRDTALKQSLVGMAKLFSANDILSVVLFDDAAWEVQQITSDHQAALQQVADAYTPGGGTNILSGLTLGAKNIASGFDPKKANKIILMTDGYGNDEPAAVVEFVKKTFSGGVEFSTIGVGSNYNQSLLELIAQSSNGTFSYVDDSKILDEKFMKEVSSAFSYIARDLRIDIYYNNKMIFSSLMGYPVAAKTDKSVSFEIAKIPQSANQLAYLKFKLNEPSAEIESTPLIVKGSYFDLVKKKTVTFEQRVPLTWTNETATEWQLDQEEKKLFAIAILNQSLKLMAEAHERHDTPAAIEALQSGKTQMLEMFPDARPSEVESLFAEVSRYLSLLRQMEKNKN